MNLNKKTTTTFADICAFVQCAIFMETIRMQFY